MPKGGKKKKQEKKKPHDAPGGLLGWFSTTRGSLVLSLVLLFFVLMLPVLVPESEAHAFEVDPARLEFAQMPAWLEPGIRADLEQAFASHGIANLRDSEELEALLEDLEKASAWIERLEGSFKVYPDELEVHLDLRKPVALVASGDGRFLVDEDGLVLAPDSSAPQLVEQHRLPLVLGSGIKEQMKSGRRIEHGALRDGIAVAVELQPYVDQLRDREIEVAVVDVTPLALQQPSRTSDIDLFTRSGLCIEWGRPAASEPFGPLEPSPATKIANLCRVAKLYPGFEGIRRVRVQYQAEEGAEFDPVSVVFSDGTEDSEDLVRYDSYSSHR